MQLSAATVPWALALLCWIAAAAAGSPNGDPAWCGEYTQCATCQSTVGSFSHCAWNTLRGCEEVEGGVVPASEPNVPGRQWLYYGQCPAYEAAPPIKCITSEGAGSQLRTVFKYCVWSNIQFPQTCFGADKKSNVPCVCKEGFTGDLCQYVIPRTSIMPHALLTRTSHPH